MMGSKEIQMFWVVEEEKLTSKTIKLVQLMMERLRVRKGIIISKNLTTIAKKDLKDMTNISLELFNLDEL